MEKFSLTIKTIVFDLDGTILDTKLVYAHASKQLYPNLSIEKCLEHGLKIGREIENNKGKSITSLDEIDAKRWLKAWYANQRDYSTLFNDFLPLVTFLEKSGFNLAINTNRPHLEDQVRSQLKEYKINQFFDVIMTQKIAGEPKPSPKGLNLILNKFNNEPEETIFIGDSRVDIQAGFNAKIPVLAVSTGVFSYESLEKYKPKMVFSSLNDILIQFRRNNFV